MNMMIFFYFMNMCSITSEPQSYVFKSLYGNVYVYKPEYEKKNGIETVQIFLALSKEAVSLFFNNTTMLGTAYPPLALIA